MAALHHKQGRAAIAEGLYRKAAGKCKDYVRLKKKDFRSLSIYGQTLINVAITAVAANGHKLADADLQRALKVKGPAEFQSVHFLYTHNGAGVGEDGCSPWQSIAARVCHM
jgi:hypothetical protein